MRSQPPAPDATHPRHALQICASLVENPMNLGALCRTAEVFRLEALILPDLAIADDWEFRKLAASGHHWQPLRACPPARLLEWIQAQHQSGYAVLALTSHPTAHDLTQFQLPKKAALVLGRELTGIPDAIVQACTSAVAIPQFGRVESLNVHTAAAIAMYEYVRQHPLPPN